MQMKTPDISRRSSGSRAVETLAPNHRLILAALIVFWLALAPVSAAGQDPALADRPNLLLIVADDHAAWTLGIDGDPSAPLRISMRWRGREPSSAERIATRRCAPPAGSR